MRALPTVLAASLFAVALSSSPAAAAALGDPVEGEPGVTYLDLLAEAVPGLSLLPDGRATGGAPIPFRHIADPSCPCDPPETVAIDAVEALPFRSAGRDRLFVLARISEEGWNVGGTVLLMLFDLAAEPRLLDVADVALDANVAFAENPLLDLSSGDQAVLVESSHWNSSQTYLATQMIFAPADKLLLIGEVSTFSDRSCAFERTQSLSFDTIAGPTQPYADIRVRVEEELTATDEDCDEEPAAPYARTVEATYRWDAAAERFAPDSDALDMLAAENEKRF
jgi:hypothetical protein